MTPALRLLMTRYHGRYYDNTTGRQLTQPLDLDRIHNLPGRIFWIIVPFILPDRAAETQVPPA